MRWIVPPSRTLPPSHKGSVELTLAGIVPTAFLVVDVPLEFILDTVLLPSDLIGQWIWDLRHKANADGEHQGTIND